MDNEAEWENIYNEFLKDVDKPLQPISLNREFYRHTIRIHAQADSIPATWHTAGWLHHRLNSPSSPTPFIAEIVRVPVNIQFLVNLQVLSDKFYLEFYPARWFLWMTVKIDYWVNGP